MEENNAEQNPNESGFDDSREPDYKAKGVKLAECLTSLVEKKWDVLQKPQVLASLFNHEDWTDSGFELRNITFESTFGAVIGQRMHAALPKLLEMHAKLVSDGVISDETKYDLGRDSYIYSVADKEVPAKPSGIDFKAIFGQDYVETPKKVKIKAMVLETQSTQYIVVMNYQLGRWEVHIREYFKDLRDAMAEAYLLNLDNIKAADNLTIFDVVRLARVAAVYADDFQGNPYPSRLSLASYLNGSLIGNDEDAGLGLRYADGRDEGYVVSYEDSDRPEAKDVLWGGYAALHNVMARLGMAHEYLLTPDDED